MAIIKPSEMNFKEKKIRMLIAGFPGIGKTTLALSAPKPLYIDVDLSAERIDPAVFNLAAGVDQARSYEELKKDLGLDVSPLELQQIKNDFAAYETIVIDTGGKLLSIMGQYGVKKNPKYGRSDGALSQAGYGWLGMEFQRFLDHIIFELNKHIVIVFHAIEEKDGDDTKLRIKAVGSSKNNVWEVMDLGGFMEMRGNVRTLGLSNCEKYFAKGTRGVTGVHTIPELVPGTPNNFLTKLFQSYNTFAAAENAKAVSANEEYEKVMADIYAIIDNVEDVESANKALETLPKMKHVLTSKKEASALLAEKASALGLFYDKVLKAYTAAPNKEG